MNLSRQTRGQDRMGPGIDITWKEKVSALDTGWT